MTASLQQARWPLTAKIPALVAVLVIAQAAIMSLAFLIGIAREQRAHTRALGNAYLEDITASLGPAWTRRDGWDALDTRDRSRKAFEPGRLVHAAAILPDGHVLASTGPSQLQVGAMVSRSGAEIFGPVSERGDDRLRMAKDVCESGVDLGRVVIDVNTCPKRQAWERIAIMLLGANAAVGLVCAGGGWWLTRRMLRPVQLLTKQFQHGAAVAPLPVEPSAFTKFGPEFTSLFSVYNRMVRAAGEREAFAAKLADEERLATLGALAASMAHEVNNPLGGMLMAVDTLAVHGADENVRMQSLGLVRRGLETIRTIVEATLAIYKKGSRLGLLTPDALDDLRYLAGPEALRRGVRLAWDNQMEGPAVVDLAAVRQAVLNVILNAVAASPPCGVVRVTADRIEGMLRIRVSDIGPGLPPAAQALLKSADAKPPPGAAGLGLWAAVRAVNAAGGTIGRAYTTIGTALVLLFPTEARHAASA